MADRTKDDVSPPTTAKATSSSTAAFVAFETDQNTTQVVDQENDATTHKHCDGSMTSCDFSQQEHQQQRRIRSMLSTSRSHFRRRSTISHNIQVAGHQNLRLKVGGEELIKPVSRDAVVVQHLLEVGAAEGEDNTAVLAAQFLSLPSLAFISPFVAECSGVGFAQQSAAGSPISPEANSEVKKGGCEQFARSPLSHSRDGLRILNAFRASLRAAAAAVMAQFGEEGAESKHDHANSNSDELSVRYAAVKAAVEALLWEKAPIAADAEDRGAHTKKDAEDRGAHTKRVAEPVADRGAHTKKDAESVADSCTFPFVVSFEDYFNACRRRLKAAEDSAFHVASSALQTAPDLLLDPSTMAFTVITNSNMGSLHASCDDLSALRRASNTSEAGAASVLSHTNTASHFATPRETITTTVTTTNSNTKFPRKVSLSSCGSAVFGTTDDLSMCYSQPCMYLLAAAAMGENGTANTAQSSSLSPPPPPPQTSNPLGQPVGQSSLLKNNDGRGVGSGGGGGDSVIVGKRSVSTITKPWEVHIQNACFGMIAPCVMDLKLGRVRTTPNAKDAAKKESKDDGTTARVNGLRMTGVNYFAKDARGGKEGEKTCIGKTGKATEGNEERLAGLKGLGIGTTEEREQGESVVSSRSPSATEHSKAAPTTTTTKAGPKNNKSVTVTVAATAPGSDCGATASNQSSFTWSATRLNAATANNAANHHHRRDHNGVETSALSPAPRPPPAIAGGGGRGGFADVFDGLPVVMVENVNDEEDDTMEEDPTAATTTTTAPVALEPQFKVISNKLREGWERRHIRSHDDLGRVIRAFLSACTITVPPCLEDSGNGGTAPRDFLSSLSPLSGTFLKSIAEKVFIPNACDDEEGEDASPSSASPLFSSSCSPSSPSPSSPSPPPSTPLTNGSFTLNPLPRLVESVYARVKALGDACRSHRDFINKDFSFLSSSILIVYDAAEWWKGDADDDEDAVSEAAEGEGEDTFNTNTRCADGDHTPDVKVLLIDFDRCSPRSEHYSEDKVCFIEAIGVLESYLKEAMEKERHEEMANTRDLVSA